MRACAQRLKFGRGTRAPPFSFSATCRDPPRSRARLAGGGFGYLLKHRVLDVDDFLDAARRVSEGGSALDPEVVAMLVSPPAHEDTLGELTPREQEVSP